MSELSTDNNLLNWLKDIKNSICRQVFFSGGRLCFSGVSDLFLLSVFVIPSYFGVRLFFFDLTALRFFEILLLALVIKNKRRRLAFFSIIKNCSHTLFIAFYFLVIFYTNIFHPSITTILNVVTNWFLIFYLVAYLILFEYGVKNFIRKVHCFVGILTILSPLEYIIGFPPFSILDTLNKSGEAARFGLTRIMGNCTTCNGYALYLVMLLPFICINSKTLKIDLLKNSILIVLVILNVFLTGCRLTVGTGFLALFLCFLFQNKKEIKKSLLILSVVIPAIIMLLYLLRNVSFVHSLFATFFSTFDEVFKTSYASRFEVDSKALYNSSYYRKLLFHYTVIEGWFNPLMGRGGSYNLSLYVEGYLIRSVDNYYVGQYIAYAWPGVIAWLGMSFSFLVSALKMWFIERDSVSKVSCISIICYYINLWYLDQLQTFTIMFTIFSLIYVMSLKRKVKI